MNDEIAVQKAAMELQKSDFRDKVLVQLAKDLARVGVDANLPRKGFEDKLMVTLQGLEKTNSLEQFLYLVDLPEPHPKDIEELAQAVLIREAQKVFWREKMSDS